MKEKYKIDLDSTELNQPILKLTIRDQPVYILPSRCHEGSLPKDFTKDPYKMRNIR